LVAVLSVAGLSKRFGQIVVADALDLSVDRGECLGIVGPNGAGKTSVFNLIDGSLAPEAGAITMDGHDIRTLAQHERVRAGLSRAYQIPQPFVDLSVYENVLAAAMFGAGLHDGEAAAHAVSVLKQTDIWHRRSMIAGALPLLDRKRLELARALATRPHLLMLDEIAGGLTELEVHELVALIKTFKSTIAIIWIEHVAAALLAVADRLIALNFGRKIADGEPRAVMASREVREVYMGGAAGGTSQH
jgi:branched-chain amino acid transport system ATP-binding protein